IDADDLGIVFGEEAVAALLILAAEPVIVGDVAIMDGGQVGHSVRPEGLGMAEVDAALRGQSRMADAMRAAAAGDLIGLLERLRRTNLLDDLELVSEADYFRTWNSLHDDRLDLQRLPPAVELRPQISAGGCRAFQIAVRRQRCLNSPRCLGRIAAVGQLDLQ